MNVRTGQLLGSLSLATDLADGFSLEKSLRTTIVATRLARLASTDAEEIRVTFWSALLRFAGCTAFAHEEGRYFGAGDDIALRQTLAYVDFGRPTDFLKRAVRGIGPQASGLERARALGRLLRPGIPQAHSNAQCEVGASFAHAIGMPEVAAVLLFRGERWDGRGPLTRGKEQGIPFAERVADVADVAELFTWTHGEAAAISELKRRRGGELDPTLVDLFLRHRADVCLGVFDGAVWELFLETEPAPHRLADGPDELTRILEAFSRFADVASVFTLNHSRAVSSLTAKAAAAVGVGQPNEVLARHAALVHDLGRVAVPNGIWEKPGPLTPYERERVRSHTHHTEVILRLAPGLTELAVVASAAHERASGNGYHRRLTTPSIPLIASVLAAADVYVALGSARPHRPPFAKAQIERELTAMARAGELDARAVAAVLEAAGHHRAARSAWPRGLTDREVEVIRLVAIGRTNKEIGQLLGMSARTAQKHVMNVYDKLGLESRAGLALFAMENELLEES